MENTPGLSVFKMKTHTSVSLLALTCLLSGELLAQSPASAFITNGLVLYFPFNGTAKDETGNGHDGRVFGATPTEDRFGEANSAYTFNGKNAWIETDSAVLLGQTPITFSFWAKSRSSAPMDIMGIAAPVETDNEIRIMFSTAQLRQKGISFKNSAHMATWPFNVNDGVWHHFVMVMGEGNQFGYFNLKAYADGGLLGIGEQFNWGLWTYEVLDQPFTIGKQFFLGGYFEGSLDEIRVYNRPLSPSEVQQLHSHESTPPSCTPHHATATANVVNGFVVGIDLIDGGCGYTNSPSVKFISATGTGASATATIKDGVVTSITVDNAGHGYTAETVVQVSSPPFAPWLEMAVSKVRVTQHVVIGRNYVLEASSDCIAWTPVGEKFTAADEVLVQDFDVIENGRYFRIVEVP
jgi:hypothetical protein